MKSKLGYYITHQGMAGMANTLRLTQPRGVVTMRTGDPAAIKAASPGTIVVYRHFFDNESYRAGKADGARWFAEMQADIAATRDHTNYYMAINEPAIFNSEDARLLSAAMQEFIRLMHEQGLLVLSFAFPEGHPEPVLWRLLKDALGDGIIIHEYDAPEMWRSMPPKPNALRRLIRTLSRRWSTLTPALPLKGEGVEWQEWELGWRCLRYRRVLNELRAVGVDTSKLVIVIGETGIDGGVAGVNKPQRGWKEFGNIEHYLESLRWYDKEICRDRQVLFAAVFAANWNVGEGSFNVENEMELHQHITDDHPDYHEDAPSPGPAPAPTWTIEELKRIAAAQYPATNVNAIAVAAMVRALGLANEETACAVILAESGGNPQAINLNSAPGKPWDQSFDLGPCQSNTYWHAPGTGLPISPACAFNPACAMMNFKIITHGGTAFTAYSSYTRGTFRDPERMRLVKIALAQCDALGIRRKASLRVRDAVRRMVRGVR